MHRSGAPLGDPFRAPAADEYVEWCIDGDGLLLEERWFLDGSLLRRTTATVVDASPPPPSSLEPPAGLAREENPIGRRPESPSPSTSHPTSAAPATGRPTARWTASPSTAAGASCPAPA
jgi:hypothetical protein